MIKSILTCCILIVSISTNAQGNWKIGGVFSYDMDMKSKNVYGFSHGFAPGGCVEPAYKHHNAFTFTAGVLGQYNLTKKLELGAGVNYSRKSIGYEYYNYYYYYCWDNWFMPESRDFIEIPVCLRYNFLNSPLKIHTELGGKVSYNLGAKDPFWGASYLLSSRVGLGTNYSFNRINVGVTTFYERTFEQFNRLLSPEPNGLSFELRLMYNL